VTTAVGPAPTAPDQPAIPTGQAVTVRQWLNGLPPARRAEYEGRTTDELSRRAVSGIVTVGLLLLVIVLSTPYLREHTTLVLVFVGLTIIVGGWRLLDMKARRRHVEHPRARERDRFRAGAYLMAALWAAFLCATVWLYPGQYTLWLTLFCTAGMSAGAATSLSPDLGLTRRYVTILWVPATILLVASLSAQGVTLGLLLGLNFVFLWTQTGQHFDWYWQGIRESEMVLERDREIREIQALNAQRLDDELESLKTHLLRVDRLATLGTLAGGAGHELNNMSTVLMAVSRSIAEASAAGQPASDKDLDRLRRVESHVTLHAKQLLSLGRPDRDDPGPVDLGQVARDTVDMMRVARRTKSVTVTLDVPSTPVVVRATKTRLEQVLVNLIGNAVDALDDVTRPARRVRVGIDRVADGSDVRVLVEDNGVGIAEDQLEQIFEPYFTTKPSSRGTGLGLPVVRRILKGLDGSISVTSEVGVGSTFTVLLPRIDS
jgi:signal transduction histidine kinase